MNNADRALLLELAESFENAERQGQPRDVPEGARYITVSHTLATRLARALRRIATEPDPPGEDS